MTVETAAVPASSTLPAEEPETGRRTFLPEVQALRAVAVLLVVAYHLRPDLVPGGFVGVDVFFVISGYLITGHMLREARQHGRLRLAHFWANRARRILPAGLLVILLIAATATFVIPITEWRNLGRQALASTFYVQNWVLAADSVDYSASDNAATPFQHFWSLAVEEQFYLLWPLLVVAVVRFTGRGRAARPAGSPAAGIADGAREPGARSSILERRLLIVFGALVICSFGWNLIKVGGEDPAAYFTTTTRLWELGIGGLLAVALRYTERLRLLRSGLALAGLAAIAVAAFALSATTPFPGTAALIPTLGAAAVIAAGRTAGPLNRLIDWTPVQWTGNVSYSLYLWHFPIAVYFVSIVGRHPSVLESLGLLGLMLAGAAASYTWVEQPIRRARWARRSDGRALIAAAMAMVLVAGCCSVFWLRPLQQEHAWDANTARARTQASQRGLFGAAAPRAGTFRSFLGPDRAMVPSPTTAKQQDQFLDGAEGRCEPKPGDDRTRRCDFGDLHSKTVVAVVGDSHARMYAPAVLLAARQHDWHVVTFLHNSCPYSFTARIFPDAESCLAANRDTAARLEQLHPRLVVTSFYAGSRFVDDGSAWHGTAGLAQAWRQLAGAGTQVVVLEDAPAPRSDVVACVAQHYTAPRSCGAVRRTAMKGRGIVRPAARGIAGVRVLDLTDRFCNDTFCPAVIGDVLVYRDQDHVGRTYVETLTPDIEPTLVAAVRKAKQG